MEASMWRAAAGVRASVRRYPGVLLGVAFGLIVVGVLTSIVWRRYADSQLIARAKGLRNVLEGQARQEDGARIAKLFSRQPNGVMPPEELKTLLGIFAVERGDPFDHYLNDPGQRERFLQEALKDRLALASPFSDGAASEAEELKKRSMDRITSNRRQPEAAALAVREFAPLWGGRDRVKLGVIHGLESLTDILDQRNHYLFESSRQNPHLFRHYQEILWGHPIVRSDLRSEVRGAERLLDLASGRNQPTRRWIWGPFVEASGTERLGVLLVVWCLESGLSPAETVRDLNERTSYLRFEDRPDTGEIMVRERRIPPAGEWPRRRLEIRFPAQDRPVTIIGIPMEEPLQRALDEERNDPLRD
jgi:hypothetical protein